MIALQELYHFVLLDALCNILRRGRASRETSTKAAEVEAVLIGSIGVSAGGQTLALELVELVRHDIVLVEQLLLVTLQLADLFLLPIVIGLKLLHQLLVRLEQG